MALAFLVPLALSPAAAQSRTRPIVVELFTSQGCSSCPPADAYLAELARSRPDILPLSFHVTYWNSLGWHDPYSLEAATERQRRYGGLLSLDSVYTPQMVVDGKRDVVGSDRAAAAEMIAAAARLPDGPALRLHRGPAGEEIDVAAGRGLGTIWLIGYDREHRTAVGRGENGGRTLLEANVVRDIVAVGPWRGQALHTTSPPLKDEQAAVIVQAEDGSIIGAARADDAPPR